MLAMADANYKLLFSYALNVYKSTQYNEYANKQLADYSFMQANIGCNRNWNSFDDFTIVCCVWSAAFTLFFYFLTY